jgi:iron(III) transport system permease protein
MRAKNVALAAAFGVLIVCGVVPVAAMLIASATVEGRIELRAYAGLLGSEQQRVLFWNSFRLAAFTAIGGAAIGVPLGVVLARTDLPFRRLLAVLFTVPLVVPPYVSAVGWFHVLGRNGILAQLTSPAVGEWTSTWLFGLGGCIVVLVPALMPVILLLTTSLVRGIDPALEEAGRLASRWKHVLRHITLPLAARGLVFAVSLVFLLAVGEFGAFRHTFATTYFRSKASPSSLRFSISGERRRRPHRYCCFRSSCWLSNIASWQRCSWCERRGGRF